MFHILQTFSLRKLLILSTIILLLIVSPAAAFGPLGNEFLVNATISGSQINPAIAMNENGNYVIVWETSGAQGGPIRGQRYNSNGNSLGGEFLINTLENGAQPEVDTDANGNFVVAWQGFSGIKARLYNSAGVAQTDEFLVATNSDLSNQPVNVAMADNGNFVVVWERLSSTIFARLYNAAGVAQTAEFGIPGAADIPRIAMHGAGNFILTWTTSDNVFAQRFNSSGTAQGSSFQINTTAGANYSAVGVDAAGNFVVTWHATGTGLDVFARRYNAAGTALSGQFIVNTTTSDNEGNPWIAMNASGEFVIVWETGSATGFYGRRFGASGAAQGPEFLVSQQAGSFPVTAMDAEGDFVVAFTNNDIYARRFSDVVPPEFRVNNLTAQYQAFPDVAMDASGNFVITWRSDLIHGSNAGIVARRYNASAVAHGNQFSVTTTANSFPDFPAIAMSASGSFVIVWAGYEGTGSNDDIIIQRFNADGSPQGTEFRVNNAITPGNQTNPAVAMDSSGNFVVAWQTDGSGTPINAQRYNASGVAQGGEFRVDTLTSTSTAYPAVAMDVDGDFVVTWSATITPNTDVYARRYNAAGVAQNVEFIVNTTTTNIQTTPSIAVDSAGNFVVVWASTADDAGNIYGRRYNSAGTALGAEFPVNSTTADFQERPDIAMNGGGDFVVVWATWNTVGDFNGEVYAQRYNSDGSTLEDEFQVNVSTQMPQFMPAVAIDSAGDFVATWMHEVRTTPSPPDDDIYARFFSAPISPNTTITENDFFAAFEQERAAYPAIAQGIADFVPNGINMTVTLNTGEVGRVNFTVANADGFATIQIASITTLSGDAVSQNYLSVINRDLAVLLTATLDNMLVTRFGSTQNLETIAIDSSTMTLTVIEG